jgi:CRP/FNR family transcriptional regulator, cyclic AMP receptor protein
MAGAPVAALRRVPLFADLNEVELQQIALLFKERHFSAGETVVKEGSDGAAFFLVDSGEANVSVGGAERAGLKAGDHFGEIALIDEGTRSATITATTDLVCFGLTLWEFQPLVVENGAIGWKLLQSLAKKLRSAELG